MVIAESNRKTTIFFRLYFSPGKVDTKTQTHKDILKRLQDWPNNSSNFNAVVMILNLMGM